VHFITVCLVGIGLLVDPCWTKLAHVLSTIVSALATLADSSHKERRNDALDPPVRSWAFQLCGGERKLKPQGGTRMLLPILLQTEAAAIFSSAFAREIALHLLNSNRCAKQRHGDERSTRHETQQTFSAIRPSFLKQCYPLYVRKLHDSAQSRQRRTLHKRYIPIT